jgi:hypothetical protein
LPSVSTFALHRSLESLARLDDDVLEPLSDGVGAVLRSAGGVPEAASVLPKYEPESYQPASVQRIRTRKHGVAIVVESGPTEDPIKHFRARPDTVHLWWLDMGYRGKWQKTPFPDQLANLVNLVADTSPGPWSPSPISRNGLHIRTTSSRRALRRK